MKKIVSVLLSICIFATMAIPAFAVESNVTVGSFTLSEVTSTIEKGIGFGREHTQTTVYVMPVGSKITVNTDLSADEVTGIECTFINSEIASEMWNLYANIEGVTGLSFEVLSSKNSDGYDFVQMYAAGDERIYVMGNDAQTASDNNSADAGNSAPLVATTDGTAYTVQAGDTLGLLSLNNYGSYNYHNALYKANAEVLKKSGGKIYKGLVINIPTTIAKGVNAISPVTLDEGEKLYTVKSGDTLGTIAQTTYGNSNKYKDIFNRNSDRLKNANTIYTGQVIVLPAK